METIHKFSERIPCLICGYPEDARAFYVRRDKYLPKLKADDPSVRYGVCKKCGLVYQNPRITHEVEAALYSDGCYREFHGNPPEDFLQRHFRFAEGEEKWISEALGSSFNKKGKRALELGAGAGYGVFAFQKAGWDAVGVEPEEELAAFGRRRYGVRILGEYFTENSLPGETFDLIYSVNVFEHLRDPLTILQTARRKIRSNGYLHIFIPTFRSCYRKLTWIQFGSPHTVMFTHKTIGNLLAKTGFRLCEYSYHRDGELRLLAQPSEISEGLPYKEDWRFIPFEIYLQGFKYYLYYPAYAIPRLVAQGFKTALYGILGHQRGEAVIKNFIKIKRRLRVDFY